MKRIIDFSNNNNIIAIILLKIEEEYIYIVQTFRGNNNINYASYILHQISKSDKIISYKSYKEAYDFALMLNKFNYYDKIIKIISNINFRKNQCNLEIKEKFNLITFFNNYEFDKKNKSIVTFVDVY